jgi:hypothetical protein
MPLGRTFVQESSVARLREVLDRLLALKLHRPLKDVQRVRIGFS